MPSNSKGQKVSAKAHGGPIEIYGTTIAIVDDKTRVQSLDTYMDSLDMFRQIAPHGVVNAEPMNRRVDLSEALDATAPNNDGVKIAKEHESESGGMENEGSKHVSNTTGQPADAFVPEQGGGCPFMSSNMGEGMMNGVEAPHQLPHQQEAQQTPSQNGDAMSVDASSADTEFSDSVLVSRENLVPETTLPESTTQEELGAYETPREPASSIPESALAQSGGAEMDVDTTSHSARACGHQSSDESNATVAVDSMNTISPSKRPLPASDFPLQSSVNSSAITGDLEASTIKAARRSDFVDESTATGTRDRVENLLEQPAGSVHPHPKDVEEKVQPVAGEAVVAAADAAETVKAKEEMSEVRKEERGVVMNRE